MRPLFLLIVLDRFVERHAHRHFDLFVSGCEIPFGCV
jgi:hypothetical protein